jgi:flagellar basal-body rod protein FlgG
MSVRALNSAATGMQAQELLTDVISNNLANLNTTAYKRRQVTFEDLLYQNEKRVGTNAGGDTIVPIGIQVGLGVKTSGVYINLQEGQYKQTNSDLDLAIQGNGYFRVELPTGEIAYTRAGALKQSGAGQLVTEHGNVVQPGIEIPENAMLTSINDLGVVSAKNPGYPVTFSEIGQFELAMFNNEAGLQAIGNNMFVETEASGAPIVGAPGEDGFGTILQGWLETSNVNPVSEITNLITAQRGYELCSKVIQAGDEMMQTANQSKR